MKRLIPLAAGLIYLAALCFSLIVLMKSGASVFYAKARVDTQRLTRSGAAYEYQFPVNSRFYDPVSLLVLEDQRVLEPVTPGFIRSGGTGSFAVAAAERQQVTILFIPTWPGDPAASGHTYSLYIRPRLLSRDWGGRFFILLLLGLLAFFASILRAPHKRALLLGSPLGLVKCWFALFDRPAIRAAAAGSARPTTARSEQAKHAAASIVWTAFFYVLMEWLFQVTKPSFMDGLNLGEKVIALMIAGTAAALLALLSLPILLLLDLLLAPVFPWVRKAAYPLPAACLGACSALIMIDNFTYTVFQFGVVNASSLARVCYAVLFVFIFYAVYQKMAAAVKPALKLGSYRLYNVSTAALLSLSMGLVGLTFQPEFDTFSLPGDPAPDGQRPNIILLSTDGLNAESMSVYEYNRDTTPFIAGLAKESLLGQNHFTNFSHSMGSETALLTGRLPFDTHVFFSPNTLKGPDRYQHLPGILQQAGYRTVSLGVTYYVDARTINFSRAFDAVNRQAVDVDIFSRLSGYGYDNAIYLLQTIQDRLTDRLGHVFFIQEMENPFAAVTQPASEHFTDQEQMEYLRSYLAEAQRTGQPLFAHVHLLGTHGSRFNPTEQVFSKGKSQDNAWMTDFYDDAILDFDAIVQQLVSYLEDLSLYDNTILVLYTDHGQQYVSDRRLPLVIHFPNGQHAGAVTVNTQNIDIAPTVLDYMGMPKPAWMTGSSLLEEVDPTRLILSGRAYKAQKKSGAETGKPFIDKVGSMTVIQCQKVYEYHLWDLTIHSSEVAAHQNPCSDEMLDSPGAIHEKVGSLLVQFGFSLPEGW